MPIKYLPNILSVMRIFFISPIIWFYFNNHYGHLFLLLVVAFASDMLDGYIARKYNATTKLGAILDMVSDNLLINLMLVLFAFYPINQHLFSRHFALLSCVRSAVTILMATVPIFRKRSYSTGSFGKANAFMLMCSILLFVLSAGIHEFSSYFYFAKYSTYFIIILRIIHMASMLPFNA